MTSNNISTRQYIIMFLNGGKHHQTTPSWALPVRRAQQLAVSDIFPALGLADCSSPSKPGYTTILKSLVPTASSLGGYWHMVTIFGQIKLTCTSFKCCSVALLRPSRAAQMYASAALKALNTSFEKRGSRKTAPRHR